MIWLARMWNDKLQMQGLIWLVIGELIVLWHVKPLAGTELYTYLEYLE
jgi:hypothetical protein